MHQISSQVNRSPTCFFYLDSFFYFARYPHHPPARSPTGARARARVHPHAARAFTHTPPARARARVHPHAARARAFTQTPRVHPHAARARSCVHPHAAPARARSPRRRARTRVHPRASSTINIYNVIK